MILAEGVADVEDVDDFVAELDAIGDDCGCAVTALDARYVAGRRHLEAAVERANRAFAREDAIADDRGIEVLLYAAGRRQIERALEMGVSEGRWPVVVVVDGGEGIEAGEEGGDATVGTGPGGDEAEAVDRV
jgi:KEOPS complex subunit Cgi121